MRSQSLEDLIRSTAYSLGFSLVGITSAESPQTFSTYQNWIEEGNHAGMGYLATQRNLARRSDPKKILPECKSIIVTGTNYLPQQPFASTEQAEARIASYALGDDYHEVITTRLIGLVKVIENFLDRSINHKVYTDTGPILERDLAQRAGIGWIGKNTCLINPNQGSYFLLGEILIDLPLQIDAPFDADRCGTCTRCLDACPTHCILPNRTIDARRCISYLTIEEKNAIDTSLRTKIGTWIFGCDICQQVCPWNQHFAHPTEDPAFQPREAIRTPELTTFLNFQPGEWLHHMRGSPLERPRRRGLVRNAAIAAGNHKSRKYIDALMKRLHSDPESIVRSHAAWALGQIENPQSLIALRSALDAEADPEVISEIQSAIDNLS